ncbi:hypothetical protein [Nostoc sp. NMS4]|uniref:hypothetical protein n=1 Tax=Nostoc sp. NMS4 TaxID=2815390 RepID=UPI0025F2D441|nr:hypothetical protein [Nostoc sp. NMS4]MBN3925344.1 hypothetical protein [Nostoc sp. NMS4]
MLKKRELQAYVKAIELVDEQIAPKYSRPKTYTEAIEELEKTSSLSVDKYYSSNINLIDNIKSLSNDLIMGKELSLYGDAIEINEAFQDKVNQWIKILGSQTGLSQAIIIAKVNIKKQELLNDKLGRLRQILSPLFKFVGM